ncbi:MAG: ribonuclease HIII [Bacilli bacterium]
MVKSFKITNQIKKIMVDRYKLFMTTPPNYASHAFKLATFNIVIYDSLKVVFSGDFGDAEVDQWIMKTTYYDTNIIGSDEVGNGDFFGPLVVCASFISDDNLKEIKKLNVMDSKNYDDNKIIILASKLKKIVKYSIVECNNNRYNELYSKGYNIKSILAIMHKKAIDSLNIKTRVVIDQFVNKQTFEKYVNTKVNYIFETKGESKYLAIAVSSIIARDCFVRRMNIIADELGVDKIKYGASRECDLLAKCLLNEHGSDILEMYIKKNFVNYKKIMEEVL